MNIEIISESPGKTEAVGKALASLLSPGTIVGLSGHLGTGKTILTKGFAAGLGLDENDVTSPTFTIINEYPTDPILYHFDLYRLETVEELAKIGADEYFEDSGICIIEWADKFPKSLPEDTIMIKMDKLDDEKRKMTFDINKNYSQIIDNFINSLKSLEIEVNF